MNIVRRIFVDCETSQVHPFWRGQLLLFDQPRVRTISSQHGIRLLLVFFFLEVIVRPLLAAGTRWLQISDRNWWPLLQVGLATVLACWLVIKFARLRLSQLGLYSWLR